MSYYINNILNWRFPVGKAAQLGTIVHAILETIAKIKLARQTSLSTTETKIGVINVDNIDINYIINEIYQQYIILPDFEPNNWTKSDFNKIKKYTFNVLNYNNGYFNPLNRTIISAEEYINFEIKEPWALLPDNKYLRLTGIIDLVCQIDQQTIEVIDYKTSSSLTDFHTGTAINEEFVMRDIQLRFYHYALVRRFGTKYTYIFTLFYITHNTPITILLEDKDVLETEELIKTKFNTILSTTIPKLNRTWKCTRFCPYGKNTFKDTFILPLIQTSSTELVPIGNQMTICEQVHFEFLNKGHAWVEQNMTKTN